MIVGNEKQERDLLKDTIPPRNDSKASPGETAPETTFFGFSKVPVQEKQNYVRRHFSSIALKYDVMNTILSLGLHHFWKRLSVKALGLRSGDLVLEVCGGTADLTLLAAKRLGSEGRVVLYDINHDMIEGGRHKVVRSGLAEKVRFVLGDAEALSLPSDRFDAAMIGFGIRNVTRMDKGLAEMHRILKPGGRMMCLEFSLPTSPWFRFLYDFYSFRLMPFAGRLLAGNRDAYLYLPESIRMFPSPDAFAAMLQAAGFTGVTYKRLTNGIAIIYTGIKP